MNKPTGTEINVHNIIAWYRWADSAEAEIVKEMRAHRVQSFLLHDGLDRDERARRETIIEQARQLSEEDVAHIAPIPPPSLYETTPPPPPRAPAFVDDVPEWEGLIPKSSPAYRRGSKRDGTLAELDKMTARACGTPFFEDAEIAAERQRRKTAASTDERQRARELEVETVAEKLRVRRMARSGNDG